MRCNPWRWLWGVIPIAMLTWLACTWEREGIETDLRSRAETALEAEGYGWGQVALEGRDAFLSGVAPDDAEPYRATETVRNIKGIRVVRARTDAAPAAAAAPTEAPAVETPAESQPEVAETAPEPEASPAPEVQPAPEVSEAPAQPDSSEAAPEPEATVELRETPAGEPSAAELAGSGLSDAERAELEARWRAAEENERIWKSERGTKPAQAVDTAQSDAAAADEAARLKAEADSAAQAEEAARLKAEADAQAAEDAKKAEEEEVARKAAEEQRVAEEQAKAEEEAAAKRKAEEEEAARVAEAEKQKLADEETARKAAEEEAERKRLAEEEQRKADEKEQAEAEAEAQRLADEQAKAEEENAAKRKAEEEAAAAKRAEEEAEANRKSEQELAAARQQEAENAKKKAEADHCQGLMRSAMAEGVINFDRAKADLTRDSYLTLDRLAGIVKVCPQARINIAGHTDSEGEIERNQGLSERRAKAVADYLVGKGVDATRLVTEGFGEARPIAPNDTPEGMRQNRRIEFNVAPAP